MTSRICFFAFLLFINSLSVHAQYLDVSLLQTRAELSDYRETTRYTEVMGFLEAVVLASE